LSFKTKRVKVGGLPKVCEGGQRRRTGLFGKTLSEKAPGGNVGRAGRGKKGGKGSREALGV